jgi:hypothetical protein
LISAQRICIRFLTYTLLKKRISVRCVNQNSCNTCPADLYPLFNLHSAGDCPLVISF